MANIYLSRGGRRNREGRGGEERREEEVVGEEEEVAGEEEGSMVEERREDGVEERRRWSGGEVECRRCAQPYIRHSNGTRWAAAPLLTFFIFLIYFEF